DIDFLDGQPGGLAIGISRYGKLDAQVGTVATPNTIDWVDAITDWPGTGTWHFVRVVQTGGNFSLCLDGQPKASTPVPDGQLTTGSPPYLGRNFFGVPAGESHFDGSLDDVRVFKGALPCE